ncbi:Essential protein Yae1, N terminal [Paecilomyces lecythidis]
MPASPSSSTHSPTDGDSAPPSPTTTMTSTQSDAGTATQEHIAPDNSLDDIFGSSPPIESHAYSTRAQNNATESTAAEPSDLPSLRRQHVTAGYRDGVSAAKGQFVQDGFDAGFPVGAQFGMRAGTVLGILEGVLRGLETRASSSGPVKKPARSSAGKETCEETQEEKEERKKKIERIRRIYSTAVRELSVQAVFGGLQADDGQGEEKEKPESRLAKKGDSVVSKWEKRVMVPNWEENLESLEMEEEVHGEQS